MKKFPQFFFSTCFCFCSVLFCFVVSFSSFLLFSFASSSCSVSAVRKWSGWGLHLVTGWPIYLIRPIFLYVRTLSCVSRGQTYLRARGTGFQPFCLLPSLMPGRQWNPSSRPKIEDKQTWCTGHSLSRPDGRIVQIIQKYNEYQNCD